VRGEEGKGDGARVGGMEMLMRRRREVGAVVVAAVVVVVLVPVEDVDKGEEGCADCGGVKVNGACSDTSG
jgi:hypothetical protein